MAPIPPETFLELPMLPLFKGMVPADIRVVVEGARIVRATHGAAIFAEGGAPDTLFVLLAGHVEIFVEAGGRRAVVEVAERPAVLGEAALFGDASYASSARAVGDVRLLALPADHFVALIGERFDLAQRMLGSMSVRLRGLVNQIATLKLKTAAQRLAGFLLGLTDQSEGRVAVAFPYDKKLAAEWLGMTPESLSRSLGRLSELGVLRSEDGVMIDDVAALRRFCAEDGD